MKRIRYIPAILALMLLAACTEFLEEEPMSVRTSATYYKDAETLKSGLYGIYQKYTDLYWHYLPFVGELGTDESIPQFYMPQFNTVFRYQLEANNHEFVGLWYQYHFQMIGRANIVIYRGEMISPRTDEIRAIVAEAKMLRAWAYFRLAQTFGPVPLITDETVPPIDYGVPRSPLGDVYGQIVKDMSEATEEGVLPETRSLSEPGRLYRYSALGIYGKVLLTMASHKESGKVDEAFALIEKDEWGYQSIEKSAAELYLEAEAVLAEVIGTVELEADYSKLFCQKYKNTIPENMWELQIGAGRPTGNWFLKRYGATTFPFVADRDQFTNGSAVNQIMYSYRLFWTYKPGDARRDWNLSPVIFDYNQVDPNTGKKPKIVVYDQEEIRINDAPQSWAGCIKFRWDPMDFKMQYKAAIDPLRYLQLIEPNGESDIEYQSNNFPLLRYADVVLMYVEANLKNNGDNPTQEAADLFNSIRDRARGFNDEGQPVSSAETPLFPNLSAHEINLDEVMNERMRELCFECVRWFDLARTGLLDVRYNENIAHSLMPPNYKPSPIDEHDYLWPVPQQQIDRSTNKEGFFQNPYY